MYADYPRMPRMQPMTAEDRARQAIDLGRRSRSDKDILLAIEDRLASLEKKLDKLLDQ